MSARRFSTCAWIDTSRAETGSSSTRMVGRQHQGAGDRDALALAAGEHVRIAVVMLGPQADIGHHLAGPLAALGSAQARY